MAHFAELDDTNVVLRVLVVANEDITDPDGNEDEQKGITFLQKLFGPTTRWRQTSYNGNFRVRYAGIGFSYDQLYDAFIPPRPSPECTLNTTTFDWDCPLPPDPPLV